ncbi:flagellar protein FliT [Methylophaga sp.]|uniref:flagellar protein FliT n=1 Tax=Methylophaga sp. TaxID=2024840 RepID=UPI003F6A3567
MSSLSQNLDQAIKHSLSLITLAEAGDWDAFGDIEKQRQAVVAAINTDDVELSEAEQVREQLKRLIELNDQLEKVCLSERDVAMTQLRSMQKGAQVTKAYGDK